MNQLENTWDSVLEELGEQGSACAETLTRFIKENPIKITRKKKGTTDTIVVKPVKKIKEQLVSTDDFNLSAELVSLSIIKSEKAAEWSGKFKLYLSGNESYLLPGKDKCIECELFTEKEDIGLRAEIEEYYNLPLKLGNGVKENIKIGIKSVGYLFKQEKLELVFSCTLPAAVAAITGKAACEFVCALLYTPIDGISVVPMALPIELPFLTADGVTIAIPGLPSVRVEWTRLAFLNDLFTFDGTILFEGLPNFSTTLEAIGSILPIDGLLPLLGNLPLSAHFKYEDKEKMGTIKQETDGTDLIFVELNQHVNPIVVETTNEDIMNAVVEVSGLGFLKSNDTMILSVDGAFAFTVGCDALFTKIEGECDGFTYLVQPASTPLFARRFSGKLTLPDTTEVLLSFSAELPELRDLTLDFISINTGDIGEFLDRYPCKLTLHSLEIVCPAYLGKQKVKLISDDLVVADFSLRKLNSFFTAPSLQGFLSLIPLSHRLFAQKMQLGPVSSEFSSILGWDYELYIPTPFKRHNVISEDVLLLLTAHWKAGTLVDGSVVSFATLTSPTTFEVACDIAADLQENFIQLYVNGEQRYDILSGKTEIDTFFNMTWKDLTVCKGEVTLEKDRLAIRDAVIFPDFPYVNSQSVTGSISANGECSLCSKADVVLSDDMTLTGGTFSIESTPSTKKVALSGKWLNTEMEIEFRPVGSTLCGTANAEIGGLDFTYSVPTLPIKDPITGASIGGFDIGISVSCSAAFSVWPNAIDTSLELKVSAPPLLASEQTITMKLSNVPDSLDDLKGRIQEYVIDTLLKDLLPEFPTMDDLQKLLDLLLNGVLKITGEVLNVLKNVFKKSVLEVTNILHDTLLLSANKIGNLMNQAGFKPEEAIAGMTEITKEFAQIKNVLVQAGYSAKQIQDAAGNIGGVLPGLPCCVANFDDCCVVDCCVTNCCVTKCCVTNCCVTNCCVFHCADCCVAKMC